MVQVAEHDTAPATIEASVNYLLDTGETPYTYTGGPGSTEVRSQGTMDPHRVDHAQRPARGRALHARRRRLSFRRHHTKVADFFDEDEIRRVYYPEMDALVKAESGAKRVVVFDHTLRTADDDVSRDSTRSARSCAASTTTTPNGRARSACATFCRTRPRTCSRAASPSSRCGGRSAIRSRRFPLAICDARSVSPHDFVISERRYPNRVGQTYSITYNPNHHWYWFPRMRRDEALVFKVYDSLKDGRARWTAHTAFDDPTAPPNARPRESIEIRTLAFF